MHVGACARQVLFVLRFDGLYRGSVPTIAGSVVIGDVLFFSSVVMCVRAYVCARVRACARV